jgi:hypothetical protein
MAASIILSKCIDGRTFGVRIEKRENDWVSLDSVSHFHPWAYSDNPAADEQQN